MRKQSRRDSSRDWIRSGAKVSIKAYARRYGVDKYTAYDDLRAIGFPLTPGDEQWAERPLPVPKRRQRPLQDPDDDLFQWMDVGGQRMWVVGYTPGGMPYGLTEDEYDAPFDDDAPF